MNLYNVDITIESRRALPWFRRGPRILALVKVLTGPIETLRAVFDLYRVEILTRNAYTAQRSHLERYLNLTHDPSGSGIVVQDSTLVSTTIKTMVEPDPHVEIYQYNETSEDAVVLLVNGEEASSYEVLLPTPIFASKEKEVREIVEHFNPAAVTYRIADSSAAFSGNGATGSGYNPSGPLYAGGFTQSSISTPPDFTP